MQRACTQCKQSLLQLGSGMIVTEKEKALNNRAFINYAHTAVILEKDCIY